MSFSSGIAENKRGKLQGHFLPADIGVVLADCGKPLMGPLFTHVRIRSLCYTRPNKISRSNSISRDWVTQHDDVAARAHHLR